LLEKWQPVPGVQVAAWAVKAMKTQWASCNASAWRAGFDLELAKKPVRCIDLDDLSYARRDRAETDGPESALRVLHQGAQPTVCGLP